MAKNNYTLRGKKTPPKKKKTDKVGYSKKLGSAMLGLFFLIGLILVTGVGYMQMQRECQNFESQIKHFADEIGKINNEIAYLTVEASKYEDPALIEQKIVQFSLNLRPTDPRQVRTIDVHHMIASQPTVMTANRPD